MSDRLASGGWLWVLAAVVVAAAVWLIRGRRFGGAAADQTMPQTPSTPETPPGPGPAI